MESVRNVQEKRFYSFYTIDYQEVTSAFLQPQHADSIIEEGGRTLFMEQFP